MFGIRKSNISYATNANPIRNTIISENQENIEIKEEEGQEDIYKSTKFIFYKQKFTNQMEIYINLTNYKNKKLLVIIDSDSSIEGLYNQIIESIQSIPEFKNINGVRVEEIYKISNNHKINIPKEGKTSDFVNSGDYLYCDLLTDEYWIKTYFNIQALNFKKIIKLEYKLKKKMKYRRFKLMLMKGGIELFIENIKSTKKYNKFNYYLKLFEFKIKNHKKIITHNIHNNHKVKMAIDKIINFSSEIIVILKFGIIEKLIHKNIKISKAYQRNNLRVNEYNDLTFEDLINEKKFLPEFIAIKELSEEFLSTQYNSQNPNFLFYTKKRPKYPFNNYFFSNENKPIITDDKNPINELIKEEDDEEKEDKKINNNLNINDIITRRESSFNSIKTSEADSFDSNKLFLNENDDNKIINKKKSKSLFFKGEKKDLIKEEKKEKKVKIKNIIIIASFLIKEEKKKEIFERKITHQNFENNNFEFKKNIPNINNTKYSASNKNVAIYNNKSNINFLMKDDDDDDEDEEEINLSKNKNNFKIQGNNESQNRNDSEIEFESKPRTFSGKNNLKNLLFKTFVDNRNSSKDSLNELFLDIEYNDENEDSQSSKNNKKNLNKINPLISESFDDNESNSNNDEDNMDELNNIAINKFIRQNFGRRSTYAGKKKRSLFSNLRNRNKNANFYQEIKNIFDNEIFLEEIKYLFNNTCSKKIFDKIKMPESKDIEYLGKEYKFLIENKKKSIVYYNIGKGECHIYVFMTLLFLFSAMILICLNIDLLSLYY